jgi:hypothetical protein
LVTQFKKITVDYKEFLKQPDVEVNFDSMYRKQKEYFGRRYSDKGFDKEQKEILSIKTALISTDFFFSEIHESEIRKQKKAD